MCSICSNNCQTYLWNCLKTDFSDRKVGAGADPQVQLRLLLQIIDSGRLRFRNTAYYPTLKISVEESDDNTSLY